MIISEVWDTHTHTHTPVDWTTQSSSQTVFDVFVHFYWFFFLFSSLSRILLLNSVDFFSGNFYWDVRFDGVSASSLSVTELKPPPHIMTCAFIVLKTGKEKKKRGWKNIFGSPPPHTFLTRRWLCVHAYTFASVSLSPLLFYYSGILFPLQFSVHPPGMPAPFFSLSLSLLSFIPCACVCINITHLCVCLVCVCVVLLTVCPVAFSFFSFSWDLFYFLFFFQTTSRNSIQNAYSDDDQFLLFGLNKRNDGTDIPGDMRKEGF